jgi:hypothetical protein
MISTCTVFGPELHALLPLLVRGQACDVLLGLA